MKEKFENLQKPLTKYDIEFRVGNVSAKGASLLVYKTARGDENRLDKVFGTKWQRRHSIDGRGNVTCTISIYDEDLKEWVSREDVGTGATEKEKGAYSDSFKRAGFSWGIGRELYTLPFIFLELPTEKDINNKYKLTFEANNILRKTDIIEYEVEDGIVKKIVLNVNGAIKTFRQKEITSDSYSNSSEADNNSTNSISVKVYLDDGVNEQIKTLASDIINPQKNNFPHTVHVNSSKIEEFKKILFELGFTFNETYKSWSKRRKV